MGAADLQADEALHVVNAPSEPEFGNGGDADCVWTDFGAAIGIQPVAFYSDKLGRVHLTGAALSADGAQGDALCDNTNVGETLEDFRIFTLPPGYRPDNISLFPTTDQLGASPRQALVGGDENGTYGGASVPAGAVIGFTVAAGGINLEGLSFRAAG